MLQNIQKEQEFTRVKSLHDYDKFYLQLKFFLDHRKKPSPFSWQCSKTQFNKNMDDFFKDEELTIRFGGGFKNVRKYRAFAKKNRELFIWIDHHLYSFDRVQEILKQWKVERNAAYFKYYGKKHSVVLLICLILWEMIYSKIGKANIKYIDEDEIMKYVDDVMEDYLPKKVKT